MILLQTSINVKLRHLKRFNCFCMIICKILSFPTLFAIFQCFTLQSILGFILLPHNLESASEIVPFGRVFGGLDEHNLSIPGRTGTLYHQGEREKLRRRAKWGIRMPPKIVDLIVRKLCSFPLALCAGRTQGTFKASYVA